VPSTRRGGGRTHPIALTRSPSPTPSELEHDLGGPHIVTVPSTRRRRDRGGPPTVFRPSSRSSLESDRPALRRDRDEGEYRPVEGPYGMFK
jgi:hypothetical protein